MLTIVAHSNFDIVADIIWLGTIFISVSWPGDETEILETFETTSDTCFLAVFVRKLSWICSGMLGWHVY